MSLRHWKNFVTVVWFHIGNGGGEPLDGTRGSANGGVVAFFRFADDNGYAIATPVMPLIEAGLEVSEIV